MKQSPMPNNSPSYTVNQHRKPPSWAIISAAVAFQFVGVGYTNTFGVFQEYYQSKRLLNKPSSEIILIGSTASSLYMILGAFTGRFVDMFRPHVSRNNVSSLRILKYLSWVREFTDLLSKEGSYSWMCLYDWVSLRCKLCYQFLSVVT